MDGRHREMPGERRDTTSCHMHVTCLVADLGRAELHLAV